MVSSFTISSSTDNLVLKDPLTIMETSDEPLTIVFDMSHGQYSVYKFYEEDTWLANNLTALGYNVVWAWGGLNDTILASATGLVLGAVYDYGGTAGFTTSEYAAVDDWFNGGSKFFWVCADSDYGGYSYINKNASAMLEIAGSHVYPEHVSISDAYSNCGASYRVLANNTSTDPFVAGIVDGVDRVLMHGPTLLYGSNSTNPGEGIEPVALESTSLENVHPLLSYGESATIDDCDLVPPVAHLDGQVGPFVCATMETDLGTTNSGVVVVSGASPYGDYQPMSTSYYYEKILEGQIFVLQTIDFGMKLLGNFLIISPDDIEYEMGVTGNAIDWRAHSSDPKSYNITFDEVLLKEGLWNSSTENIYVLVDGLSVGVYNYTLQVQNEENITLSDTVIVTVLNPLPPSINHPIDIVYYEGNNDSAIEWTPDDVSLFYYEIFKDGALIVSHVWGFDESTIVSIYVGELPVGVFNYTIRVFDKIFLASIDTVIVEVLEVTTTTTTTTTTNTTTTTTTTTSTTSPTTSPTTTTTNTTTASTPGDILDTVTLAISIGSIIVILVIFVLIAKNKT